MAFIDGLETRGTPILGSVLNDQFVNLTLDSGVAATDYNFGERGLHAELVSKEMFLSSYEHSVGTVLDTMIRTSGAYGFRAPEDGLITAQVAGNSHQVTLGLYTAGWMPVSLSHTGETMSAPVSEGEDYVLLVSEGQASSEFQVHTSLRESQPAEPIERKVYHNSHTPTDTNDDGELTPADALRVVNYLNRASAPSQSQRPLYLDTNNDGHLTPADALLVVNSLNQLGARRAEAEPESLSFTAPIGYPRQEITDLDDHHDSPQTRIAPSRQSSVDEPPANDLVLQSIPASSTPDLFDKWVRCRAISKTNYSDDASAGDIQHEWEELIADIARDITGRRG